MILEDREQLIEAVGVHATDRISDLVERIENLERHLDIVPVFGTKGWSYKQVTRPPVEELKSVE